LISIGAWRGMLYASMSMSEPSQRSPRSNYALIKWTRRHCLRTKTVAFASVMQVTVEGLNKCRNGGSTVWGRLRNRRNYGTSGMVKWSLEFASFCFSQHVLIHMTEPRSTLGIYKTFHFPTSHPACRLPPLSQPAASRDACSAAYRPSPHLRRRIFSCFFPSPRPTPCNKINKTT
jgi:hypothetical protein